MLEEIARVVAADNGSLWVEAQSRGTCDHCDNSSCTSSVLSKLFGARRNRLQIENSLGASTGQQVVIGIPDELLLRASVWAYLLPLVIMLLTTLVASALGMREAFQSLLALCGLAVGFLMLHWTNQSLQQQFKPQLLRIVNQTEVQPIAAGGSSCTRIRE